MQRRDETGQDAAAQDEDGDGSLATRGKAGGTQAVFVGHWPSDRTGSKGEGRAGVGRGEMPEAFVDVSWVAVLACFPRSLS